MTITRRTFTAGIGALFVSHTVSGCTDPATDSGNPAASSTGPSGVRELVTMDQPDFTGVDLGHVSPDPTGIEATVATATVDPSRRQCLFLWEEGNAPTTTGPGSGGHDPAGFRPTVTSVPTTGNTTVKGAMLLCAGGAFALRGDNSDCYPTAARLSALGYHCFIVDYRVRPHTQAEAGDTQPDELVLISPWVDITNANPDIADYVDADPLMVPEPLAEIGRCWAGDTPPIDWHLSPIYGDLSGLRKVTTFVGTREIFLPDNALFHAKLLEAGVDSTLHVGESLNHVYPMFPTPEGHRARRDLVRLVTGEPAA